MRDYFGEFEMHLSVNTSSESELDSFRAWCRQHDFKCVHIVLERGLFTSQPMATWQRANTNLPTVVAEIDQLSIDANLSGLKVNRTKVEASPLNAEIPQSDSESAEHNSKNYFEHHLKLLRNVGAPTTELLKVCVKTGAHLSRNAFRQPSPGTEERFVTLRSYGVGRATSMRQLKQLEDELAAINERIIECESEYCVYDSNIGLDAGWLEGALPMVHESELRQQTMQNRLELPSMTDLHDTEKVMVDFLRKLDHCINEFQENLAPVLRGSLLLRHWFGDEARPAADIDLECFNVERLPPDPDMAEYANGGLGRWGEFESLVDFGKAMCRYAVNDGQGEIEYYEVEPPEDGASLWVYGTPGERYYTGWRWSDQSSSGQLQVDIASPGRYQFGDFSIEPIRLEPVGAGSAISFSGYSKEMMLAAKLSWVLRSLTQSKSQNAAGDKLVFFGEPKDLFDARLLAKADIDEEKFRHALAGLCIDDDIEWKTLDHLLEAKESATEFDPAKWYDFNKRFPNLINETPEALLLDLVKHLKPKLGQFYLPDESHFLAEIGNFPIDASACLVYADWLEERGDNRASFLRHLAEYKSQVTNPMDYLTAWQAAPQPWLCRLFGSNVVRRKYEPVTETPQA